MPACLFKPLDFTTHSEAAQLATVHCKITQSADYVHEHAHISHNLRLYSLHQWNNSCKNLKINSYRSRFKLMVGNICMNKKVTTVHEYILVIIVVLGLPQRLF